MIKKKKKPRINPIRKRIVKRELLKGESARTALKKANYSPSSIRQSTHCVVVKQCMKEIEEEFKLSDITVEKIVRDFELAKKIALESGDMSNWNRANECLGRYLAMFTDKKELSVKEDSDKIYSEMLKNRAERASILSNDQ